MANNDVINVDGEQQVVREDTARSHRGGIWILLTVLTFLIVASIMFFGGFFTAVKNGDVQSPAQIEQKRQ